MKILAMFDVDGTLTESFARDAACFMQAVEELCGIQIPDSSGSAEADWNKFPHCTDTGIFHTLFQWKYQREPRRDETGAFLDRVTALLAAEAQRAPFVPMPGARALLEELAARPNEFALSIATGACAASAGLKLASAGLEFPEAIMPRATSDDSRAREGIMQRSLERALAGRGVTEFSRIVYFGDGLWDARACQALGWPFLGIAPKPEKAAQLAAAGAFAVFPDLTDHASICAALRGAGEES